MGLSDDPSLAQLLADPTGPVPQAIMDSLPPEMQAELRGTPTDCASKRGQSASDLSHKALCKLAVAWLQRPSSRSGPGCMVAVSETTNAINGEIPDAIGWRPYAHQGCGSVLVEVKVSRADFLADASKPHRLNSKTGMGTYRYFMAPAGLIAVEELPPRWGLVEVTSKRHLKVRAGHVLLPNIRPKDEDDPWRHTASNTAAEMSMLVMILNRVGDPQRLQDRLRELGNRLSHAVTDLEKHRTRNRELAAEVFQLRHGNAPLVARPRVRRDDT